MFARLLVAFALASAVFSSPAGELSARQAATVPAGYYPVYIANSKSDKWYIEPQAPVKAGSAVLLSAAANTTSQTWLITSGATGATKVYLNGTNFCLEAGTARSNGSPITVATCVDNQASQNWEFNKDKQLVIATTKICADLYAGSLSKGTKIVLWGCIAGDGNHIWKAINATTPN